MWGMLLQLDLALGASRYKVNAESLNMGCGMEGQGWEGLGKGSQSLQGFGKKKTNAPLPGSQQTATSREMCDDQGLQKTINSPAA